MSEALEARIVAAITRRYGTVINLGSSPGVIIEIIREFGPQLDVAALHPPTPVDPRLRDVMKEILKISRDVSAIRKQLERRT